MRLRRIGQWLPGYVTVEIEGGFPERMLNELTCGGIAVWRICRREESVRLCCLAGDYRRLRRPAKRAGVRMRVRRKRGLPFLWRRYRRRRGLLAALALYAAILALLSPRIWAIEVVGNSATDAAEICAVAEQAGIRLGARTDRIRVKELEIDGLGQLPTLAWISVDPSGSVARIEVIERGPTPQILDLSVPSDIVALRDGVIVSMTVVSGQRAVMVGEAVEAGRLLIGGRIESGQGERLTRAYGEVWAETQRQIAVSVPLTYDRAHADGLAILRPTLHFLWLRLPLFADRTPEGEFLSFRREHFLRSGGLKLPLGVTNDYLVRVTRRTATRTREEAEALAQRQLTVLEGELFSDIRFARTACKADVTDDELRLTAVYTCEENIAMEVPLGQSGGEEMSKNGR